MDNDLQRDPHKESPTRLAAAAGLVLVTAGLLMLLEQYARTGWLGLVVPPAVGAIFLLSGMRFRRLGLIIAGAIITGLGMGVFAALNLLAGRGVQVQVGGLLLCFAVSWLVILLASRFFARRVAWWALVPGGILASAGLCFCFTSLRLVDLALYLTLGVGLSLLVWGIARRIFGLIIPGGLLCGIGPGIYLAWGGSAQPNPLAQTGLMLVWFAFGWGLVILFSRMVTAGFVWWPLIPGGVLAMTGWGLYIGGNPGGAASFIGNTGSIGLIIFGLYLLLMRSGIQR